MRAGSSFLRPIPDWRVALVWRLYGWAGLQEVLLLGGGLTWRDWFARAPLVIHGLAACSILLLLLGPRPALLAVTAVVTSALLWITAGGRDPFLDFPGAELPLFALLPLGTIVLWALGRRRSGDAGGDDVASFLWLYRIGFLLEMGFATLHKLNRDFLNPALSCALVLREMLPQWWDTPLAQLAHLLSPPVVLGFEGGIPVLAIVYWPAGLLLMLGFLLGLAMIGPTGFTAVTIAAGVSFVRGTTARRFYSFPRRHPWVSASGAALLVAYTALVHRAPPRYPWPEFALYVVVVAFLGVCLAGEVLRDVRGRRDGGLVAALRLGWPRSKASQATLVAIAFLGVANGLTPYFGYKYHFSFSMLSNLRADSIRWNSYVVPRWLRLVDSDPYVEVTKVRIQRAGGRRTDPDLELFEAYFPPYEFVRRVRYHLAHGHEVHVWLRYQGEEKVFLRVSHNPEARAFLDSLPRWLLFQKVVTAGPQPCVH